MVRCPRGMEGVSAFVDSVVAVVAVGIFAIPEIEIAHLGGEWRLTALGVRLLPEAGRGEVL